MGSLSLATKDEAGGSGLFRQGRKVVTKRERKRLAEALLDPSSTAQYLLSRLDEGWEAVTPAVLMKLGKRYGAAIVTDALRYIRRDDVSTMNLPVPAVRPSRVENPVAYLETCCARIQEGAA